MNVLQWLADIDGWTGNAWLGTALTAGAALGIAGVWSYRAQARQRRGHNLTIAQIIREADDLHDVFPEEES